VAVSLEVTVPTLNVAYGIMKSNIAANLVSLLVTDVPVLLVVVVPTLTVAEEPSTPSAPSVPLTLLAPLALLAQ